MIAAFAILPDAVSVVGDPQKYLLLINHGHKRIQIRAWQYLKAHRNYRRLSSVENPNTEWKFDGSNVSYDPFQFVRVDWPR